MKRLRNRYKPKGVVKGSLFVFLRFRSLRPLNAARAAEGKGGGAAEFPADFYLLATGAGVSYQQLDINKNFVSLPLIL
jgi:hypothetical protein